MKMASNPNRRTFLQTAAGTAAITIVPRHVLGGAGFVAPSEKITLAYIGTGTQGLREMPGLLANPEIQIVAVCDPCKEAVGYRDWSRDGLLNDLRRTLERSDWRSGTEGVIPGGRDAGKSLVETWYASKSPAGTYKGCAAYADVRELLDKQKDLDSVKIMTPDHLHGIIAIAAMKRGKHVLTHKPIANRLKEYKLVAETARKKGVATLLVAWDSNQSMNQIMGWIQAGAIGTLREVHNWSNRPVWPQYAAIPTDRPPVPQGLDWDLWLGPEADRPYHPDYTNMVFRGWYDFGGGSMADMGHYSLWSVFNALELTSPISVDPMFTHECTFRDNVATTLRNDYSFPIASCVRFRYPAHGARPAVDLVWYDGGMRPPTPEELEEDHKELEIEGMMFVGEKGKILADFHGGRPRLIPERKMRAVGASSAEASTAPRSRAGVGLSAVDRRLPGRPPARRQLPERGAAFGGRQPLRRRPAVAPQAVLRRRDREHHECAGGEQVSLTHLPQGVGAGIDLRAWIPAE